MGIPAEQPLAASREELKRCFSDVTSLGHAAAQLDNMTQGPNESLQLYIHHYSKMHDAANKTAKNTDPPDL